MKNKPFQIAIDGPVGAGKSTVAYLVAKRLGCLFIDTGAMYRAVALGVIQGSGIKNIDLWQDRKKATKNEQVWGLAVDVWEDEERVGEMVGEMEVELVKPEENDDRKVTVLLGGVDVSGEIRNDLIGEGASIVSQFPVVREVLVAKQQLIAGGESVVMEGRDIGSRVLPEAQLKIFLTASEEERVMRKMSQSRLLGMRVVVKEVAENLRKRDEREMSREIDPLTPSHGSWIFDTTGLTIDEVVGRICGRAIDIMSNE